MKVAGVAGHEKSENLTRAVRKNLVPMGPAFEDHEHGSRSVAFPDEVVFLGQSARAGGGALERFDVSLA
ncbi:hypothetical protein GCM10022280_25110 [Sphingomonas swuensis]|uniref:Uncharacterized protein n=1 Tax=Sphingomonas swuensis TaxID=977800 RepID=A0ABP7TA91_9SPHN